MELSLQDLKELLSNDNTEKTHHLIGRKVIIRTYSAGVHYGTLLSKDGLECVLSNSIRIWHWDGAATLSQLSVDGTNNKSDCKFSVTVPTNTLQWIEILPCSEKSITSIEGVTPWKQ